MRSAIIISALTALALAAPRPQDIEFDQVDAAPDVDLVTPPVIGTTDSVVIQPSSAAISIGADAVTDVATTKRDLLRQRGSFGKRDGNCAVQPAGTGPQVSTLVNPNLEQVKVC